MSPGPRTQIAFLCGPPARVETLRATRVAEALYRLDQIPLHARGVSLGDVVQARRCSDPRPTPGPLPFERVVRKGGNRTLRLLARESGRCAELLAELAREGCRCEHAPPLVVINVPPAASLDAVMDRLVRSGCRWENLDPEAAAVPGRVAYLMQPREVVDPAPGDDLIGDATSAPRPCCTRCGRPLSTALLLRAHPRRLRFVRSAAVELLGCAAGCEATARLLPSAPAPGGLATVLRYTRCEEHNPWADGRRPHHGGVLVDKLGGYPQWRGAERTPRCPVCREPMALVAQLSGCLTPAGYLFVCADEHAATFVR